MMVLWEISRFVKKKFLVDLGWVHKKLLVFKKEKKKTESCVFLLCNLVGMNNRN